MRSFKRPSTIRCNNTMPFGSRRVRATVLSGRCIEGHVKETDKWGRI